MTTPFKSDYAFGLHGADRGRTKVIEHGGGIEGFNTFLAYYPDDKLTVVVLANVNGGAPGEIATKLAVVGPRRDGEAAERAQGDYARSQSAGRYVGAYQMAAGPAMLVTLENNQLFCKLGNQNAIPIFPESQTMFFPKVVDAELEFTKDDAQGKPTEMILHQNGRDQTAKRVDDAEFKRIADGAAAAAKRFKDQTAMPGSDVALRKMIDDLRMGSRTTIV